MWWFIYGISFLGATIVCVLYYLLHRNHYEKKQQAIHLGILFGVTTLLFYSALTIYPQITVTLSTNTSTTTPSVPSSIIATTTTSAPPTSVFENTVINTGTPKF